jgi:hypothetical protein
MRHDFRELKFVKKADDCVRTDSEFMMTSPFYQPQGQYQP